MLGYFPRNMLIARENPYKVITKKHISVEWVTQKKGRPTP